MTKEQEQYQTNLEILVKARTEQLSAVYDRIKDAAPALRTIGDDPNVRKLLEVIGR